VVPGLLIRFYYQYLTILENRNIAGTYTLSTSFLIGISECNNNKSFSIIPNPNTGIFNIKLLQNNDPNEKYLLKFFASSKTCLYRIFSFK